MNKIIDTKGFELFFQTPKNTNLYEQYEGRIFGRVGREPCIWKEDGTLIEGKGESLIRLDHKTPLRKELSEKLRSGNYVFLKTNTAYKINEKYQTDKIPDIIVNKDLNFGAESQLEKYLMLEK